MVDFRDEIIDPGRESRVAGARQDLDEVILKAAQRCGQCGVLALRWSS